MAMPIISGDYAAVVGGGDVSRLLLPLLRGASLVVAADSGVRFLLSNRIMPDILVGDFDSCDAAAVERVKAGGRGVVALPVDKDVTDTEAALDILIGKGCKSVVLLGALGGNRPEHGIANLSLVERYAREGMDVTIVSPRTSVSHVSGPGYVGATERVWRGMPGDWVSLFPVTETVCGVTTANLKFPLLRATLLRGATLGVSNEMLGEEASVSAGSGFSLIVLTERGR